MIKKRHTPKQKTARTNNLLWESCKREAMGRSTKFTTSAMARALVLYKERSK